MLEVNVMNLSRYKEIVDNCKPNTPRFKNILFAFLGGGLVGLIGQFLFFVFHTLIGVDEKESIYYLFMTVVFITAILTITGAYKKLASKLGAGIFLPTTGFANAMISSSIEARFEGPIFGFGSKVFNLAGSVIAYGVISAFFYGLICYFLSLLGVL